MCIRDRNNSLKAWSFDFSDFGLEGRQRAEELTVQQFIALANDATARGIMGQ